MEDLFLNLKKLQSILSNRTFLLFIFILIVLLFIINSNIYFPFRYKITGTNEGIIYKTDIFTGKTWVVSPEGEKEILPKPSPKEIELFPISELQIISTGGVKDSFNNDIAKTIVTNNSNSTAKGINFKIIYYDKIISSSVDEAHIIDTDYYVYTEPLRGGDTVTIDIPLKSSAKRYWFTVEVYRALSL